MNAAPQIQKTRAVDKAVETYANMLGIPVADIPLDQHIAVMAACVEAVKAALDELAEEMGK